MTTFQTRIHERIASDLPFFNEQISSAKSIQERLRTLTDNVDGLEGHLSDTEVCSALVLWILALSCLQYSQALFRHSLRP